MTVIISPVLQQATLAINAQTFGGSLPNGVNSSLIEIKYSYPGFSQANLSGLTKGDLIVFEADNTLSANIYGAKAIQSSTGTPTHASKALMIFISYINDTLIAMHKGYLDFDDTLGPLQGWEQGSSLYANNEKIDISPSGTSGHWVKSLGFCMPNTETKKRIWFEPDSTYLILQ